MHPDVSELTLRNTSAFPERVRHHTSLAIRHAIGLITYRGHDNRPSRICATDARR
jgi:hypothetical protein